MKKMHYWSICNKKRMQNALKIDKRVGRKIIWILISVKVQISRVGREKILKINKRTALLFGTIEYTQSPLIRTTAKWPTLGVLKNSSNLDAHRFLILQVWALAGS